MKEKIIIVFVATVVGLLLTAGIYYIYQTTQAPAVVTDRMTLAANVTPTPGQTREDSSKILIVSEPTDEEVVDRRTLQVKGRTTPDSTVVVTSGQEDVVGRASSEGDFAISIEISAGVNKIITRVIAPNGDTASDEKVVTYSTEEF